LIEEFAEFFKKEALLGRIEAGSPNGDIISDFETDGKVVKISLTK
jgi:hypothetical protein